MSGDTPRRLGRGLEALISTARQQRESTSPAGEKPPAPESDLQRIRIADIEPNHFQPRRTFAESDLAELEASIRVNGLLQPITVRPRGRGRWELVAGERRLRAATRIGWTEIPAVVRDFDDRAMLTLALVENLQRSDLNALEEAEGYQRLIDDFGLTQQQVADAVGKDRTTITNLIRILHLPASVKRLVQEGTLSAGHARALLVLKTSHQQQALANEVVARQLSVRQTEAKARGGESGGGSIGPTGAGRQGKPSTPDAAPLDSALARIEEQFRRRLQTDVSLQVSGDGKGIVRVAFYSPDDLDRLLDLIVGSNRSDFD
jgi:ParB family chromosome partitioning protein